MGSWPTDSRWPTGSSWPVAASRPLAGAWPDVGAFAPAAVAGATPIGWHRADVGVQKTAAGGVFRWNDLFGNGLDVVQATVSKQPTVSTLAGGAPALRFARANSQLLLATNSTVVNALAGGTDRPYTVYVVFQAVTIPAAASTVFCLGSSASSTTYSLTYFSGTTGVLHHERRDGVGADTDATMSGAVVAVTDYLLRIRFSGTAASYYLNGVELTPSVSNDVGVMALDRYAIGAVVTTAVAGSTFLDGLVAEVITYTGLVPVAEESRLVEEYFTPRYTGVA